MFWLPANYLFHLLEELCPVWHWHSDTHNSRKTPFCSVFIHQCQNYFTWDSHLQKAIETHMSDSNEQQEGWNVMKPPFSPRWWLTTEFPQCLLLTGSSSKGWRRDGPGMHLKNQICLEFCPLQARTGGQTHAITQFIMYFVLHGAVSPS